MTSPVRILFVDDRAYNFDSVRDIFEQIFASHDCVVTFEYESKPRLAYAAIDSGRYDVIITDLFFPPNDQPDAPRERQEATGYEIIKRAKRHPRDIVIVALTSGDPDDPGLERNSVKFGCDIYCDRRDLRPNGPYGGPEYLVGEIYEELINRGLIDLGPKLVVADEPGIQAVLYDVSPRNMRLLLADVLRAVDDTSGQVTLSFVTPGASGAQVIRAVTESGRQLLVKISRDRPTLERETDNFKKLLGMYGDLIVQYGSGVFARKDWFAIVMEFAENSSTLRSWLSVPGSAPHVDDVFGRLFVRRGLATRYHPGELKADPRPLDTLRPQVFRRVRVRAAVERLAPVLGHEDGAGVADAGQILDVIARFTSDARIGDVAADETPKGLLLVPSHGDLHGGNVLVRVDGHPQPLIIDINAFGDHHWAFDPARLMVDIVLRSLDNTVESYLWRRFGDWRALAKAAGDFDVTLTDSEPGNAAAVAALRWIAEHRGEILPATNEPDQRWEWHVCLAEQYLRGTYQDVPPAKQTLALVAAHDQIKAAESVMPRWPRDF